MELLMIAGVIVALILAVLAILAPYFVYRINGKCSEQISYLRANLEAQNKMIQILWEINQKTQ